MEKANEFGIDLDILASVSNYVEKYPQKFEHMSKEDFINLLNDVTNGKYSLVVQANSNKTQKNNFTKTIVLRVIRQSKAKKRK